MGQPEPANYRLVFLHSENCNDLFAASFVRSDSSGACVGYLQGIACAYSQPCALSLKCGL